MLNKSNTLFTTYLTYLNAHSSFEEACTAVSEIDSGKSRFGIRDRQGVEQANSIAGQIRNVLSQVALLTYLMFQMMIHGRMHSKPWHFTTWTRGQYECLIRESEMVLGNVSFRNITLVESPTLR
mmetsp:Transcript_32175/g.78178  ORF Transcript_32175/g.78178 Transcript_32175/m.78178 type:complete len:124 (-) Transcript_32175:140-511(-)